MTFIWLFFDCKLQNEAITPLHSNNLPHNVTETIQEHPENLNKDLKALT